jgi:hypothetical protein
MIIPQGIVSDPALQGFSKVSLKVDADWFISEEWLENYQISIF